MAQESEGREARSLAPSHSFSGSSSETPVARPLKRTLTSTSDLDFFKPAASSFNPRPYTPSVNPPPATQSRNKYPHLTRHHNRSDPHSMTTLGMDPSPSDPHSVFIHPPFSNFPGVQNSIEGLTYKLMSENPEWFLDANDYVRVEEKSSTSLATAPARSLISYPSYLEPPRGWCPAKKKDLKDLGAEGWPEGEEPRLRCTFCRRTYAGVNAKSMWRRHVFEKHRIAMSNRRDGGDRPRGRGSMKENQFSMKPPFADGRHESLVHIEVPPQHFFQGTSQSQQKIRFRPTITGDPILTKSTIPSTSTFSVTATSTPVADNSETSAPPLTPPLTPSGHSSSDPVSGPHNRSPTSTPPPIMPSVPPSPYDPQATPAFRHSPAPLPSDQPWRYPSPSHPFSKARDLSLSVLLRGSGSLSTVDSPSPMPSLIQDDHSSPSSSLVSRRSFFVGLNTPGSVAKPQLTGLKSSAPVRRYARLEESPLSRGLRTHQRNISDLSLDDWLALPARNPFLTSYDDWDSEDNSSPVVARLLVDSEMNPTESPVVRREISSEPGQGIGLLEPFKLPENHSRAYESSSVSEAEDEFEVAHDLIGSHPTAASTDFTTRPPKKRRISTN